jgi:DNA helicase HerA-like ATPase
VVRLIRSKGVGVFFVTQNPIDVPDKVLAQLGNRVQHALRAFTPRDQKAVKAAAETMRANPKLDVEKAITELGVGEALVSFLDDKGRPGIVERALVVPPASQLGPIGDDERRALIANSIVAGVYEKAVDRESAYEILKGRATPAQAAPGSAASRPAGGAPPAVAGPAAAPAEPGFLDKLGGLFGSADAPPSPRGGLRRESVVEAMAKSAARAVGSQVGREIIRGVLGLIFGGGGRRR